MIARIDMGMDGDGKTAAVDLEELLATRLLVQGNSGSGKSHLLRRLLEGSAGLVQQIVIDPEGDFVSLSDAFGHVSIEAGDYSLTEIAQMGARIREHRASVVLNLEGLEMEGQMRCAAAFLGALFDAPRDHWYPAMVVVDEAQVFAPAVAGEVSDEARRASLSAMTNLMCRGRKRGLAGIIATQRLAKLAKNVAAEASNFLMGRTFLDIDMVRAADLLGMERRQAEVIRDLARGQFLALGPAITRRPLSIRIGEVRTLAKSASPKLVPLPSAPREEMEGLLFAPLPHEDPVPLTAGLRPIAAEALISAIAGPSAAAPVPELPELEPSQKEAVITSMLADLASEEGARSIPAMYQDFQLRCRMRGISGTLPLPQFRKRLALTLAGISEGEDWDEPLSLGASLPEEMLPPFLALARAARAGEPCPSDEELAALYRTTSPARARRMLAFIEEKGLIASRIDLGGKRTISLPHLGCTTAPAAPDPTKIPPPARARRSS